MGSWKYNNNQFKLTGTMHLSSSAYVNWGDAVTGSSGFGIRDNAGTIQVKHSGGSWAQIAADGVMALDDIDAGDAASTLETTSGNITIDSNAGTVTVDGHTGVTVQSSDSGDITLDSAADVVIDAAGGNVEFKDAGTTQLLLDMDTTAGEIIMQLQVNSDDFVFKQYDGTEVFRVEDDGSFDIAGGLGSSGVTVTAAGALSADGRIVTDDTTDATSKTDGSLQTDGGLSVAKAIYNGTAATLAADSGVVTMGAATALTVSAAGLLNVNNATEATSATDGSLQTDGGLSVVKSAVIGDDLDLLSDGAIMNIGSTSKFTLTDQAANNCVMAASGHRLAFGDAGDYVAGDGTDLTVNGSADIKLTAGAFVEVPANIPLAFDGTGHDDKISSDGTDMTIAAGGGDIVLDASDDLVLDAGGADVFYKVAGSVKARLIMSGSDEGEGYTRLQAGTAGAAHELRLSASSMVSFEGDKGLFLDFESGSSGATIACGSSLGDILFTVDAESGGAEIFRVDNSATSLLMAGTKKIEFTNGDAYINHDGTDLQLVDNADINIKPATDFLVDAGNDIILDSDNGEWKLQDGGTDVLHILHANSGDMTFENKTSNKDMIFKVNDGGSETEVFRLDGDVSAMTMASGKRLQFADTGEYIVSDGTNLTIESGGSILMGATVSPDSNGGQDLGASGAKWDAVYANNVYTGDLHLKNERGDWSVIEESNYLTLRHNTSGKRFKLLMEELSDGEFGPGNDGVM